MMTPAEYRKMLSRMAANDERVRTIVALVHMLEGYSTIESLARNYNAIRRMNDESAADSECRAIVKELRKRGLLWRGFYDEFLCPEGFEDAFEDVASEFVSPPKQLSAFFEECVSKKDIASLKMLELMLKMPYEHAGMTQYEMLKTEISDMFSPDVFKSIEERMIGEGICFYMKKAKREFLSLRHEEEEKKRVRDALVDFREEYLRDLASSFEKRLSEFADEIKEDAKKMMVESLAVKLGVTPKTLDEFICQFSGFSMDDTMMFLTTSFSVMSEVIVIVLTDRLSRYDAYTWHTYPEPTLFIAEEMPSWVNEIESVFRNAYPPLKERKIAIASSKSKKAYANFESELLKDMLNSVMDVEEIVQMNENKRI